MVYNRAVAFEETFVNANVYDRKAMTLKLLKIISLL